MQSRQHSSHLVIMASLSYVSHLKTSHCLSFPLEYFQAIFLFLQSLLPPLLSSADLTHFSAVPMSLSVAEENILTFFIDSEIEYAGHAFSDVRAKCFSVFYKQFYQRLLYFIHVYFKNIKKIPQTLSIIKNLTGRRAKTVFKLLITETVKSRAAHPLLVASR